jgi:membrane-associated phospholipid phosphatase
VVRTDPEGARRSAHDGRRGQRPKQATVPAAAGVRGGLRRRAAVREALIFLSVYVLYEAGRTLGTGSTADAVRNAHRVTGLERAAGLDVEGRIQGALTGTPWLTLLDWVYLAAQTVALAGGLVFAYRRRPRVYRALRTTLIGAWVISLPVYALFPTAPPRLAGIGIADSVSAQTPVSLDASSTGIFFNPYAAVPSLHAAFAVALGIGVAVCLRRWSLRGAALLWGPLVALSVLATGNHFVVDIAAGLVVTLIGFAAACLTARGRRRRAGSRAAPGRNAGGFAGAIRSEP